MNIEKTGNAASQGIVLGIGLGLFLGFLFDKIMAGIFFGSLGGLLLGAAMKGKGLRSQAQGDKR